MPALLIVTGCAGWEPYAPPLQREMPEGSGLFSGPDGEFVIERSASTAREREDEQSEAADEAESANETGALRPEAERP